MFLIVKRIFLKPKWITDIRDMLGCAFNVRPYITHRLQSLNCVGVSLESKDNKFITDDCHCVCRYLPQLKFYATKAIIKTALSLKVAPAVLVFQNIARHSVCLTKMETGRLPWTSYEQCWRHWERILQTKKSWKW